MNATTTLLAAVRRRKPTKNPHSPKPKPKPIKIVYISNPMKVHTSAARFRTLVQELTGQDAEFPHPSNFPAFHDAAAHPDLARDDDGGVLAAVEELGFGLADGFEELFSSPVIDSFSGLLQSAVVQQSYAR